MRTNQDFFDKHMKTRIALQLLLDAIPFVLLCGFGACTYNLFTYPLEQEWLVHIGIWGFMLGTVPLCILGKVSRKRMKGRFVAYETCEKVSRVFALLGAVAACWSVLALFLCLLNIVRI